MRDNAGITTIAYPMPDSPDLLAEAIALHQQGDAARASTLYRAILQREPRHLDALYLLGLAEHGAGNAGSACELIAQAVAIAPQHAAAHFALGNALLAAGRRDDAAASYGHALALRPDYHEAWYNRARALQELGRIDDALADYDAALALQPDDVDTHVNRATALQEVRRDDDALAAYERALALAPGHAKALYNRGTAHQRAGRLPAALADFDAALATQPHYVEALINRGAVLEDLGHGADALAAYEQALRINPKSAKAHWNAALSHLLAGDFARGWPRHEWRWDALNLHDRKRNFTETLWLGEEPLAGKTILLHAEQGLGDTLQFCRYAPLVAALGARVILEVQAPLKGLLDGLPGVDLLLAHGDTLPPFDFHCPLLSLPLAFRTDFTNLPAQVPYLHADPAFRAIWKARLGGGAESKVGLAWSGNPKHGKDQHRSLPLAAMGRLAEAGLPMRFVSVQKEVRETDRAYLAAHPEIVHCGADLTDFSQTAALVASLDLVITVDTSIAHLAGALGKPVWILLPFSPDWRWLRGRGDSPWYPTAQLLRQSTPGDWDSVLVDVLRQLKVIASR
jgi:tetratricopeptide (TPR) repeat protein